MLNSERKEAFVEWYATQYEGTNIEAFKQKLLKRFKLLEEFEGDLGKDICDFTAEEIKSTLSKSQKTYSSAKEYLRGMRAYAGWCAKHGYCSPNNAYELISAGDIEVSKSQADALFSGIRSFEDYLDRRFRPVDEMSIDNITRVACWLLFFGVDIDDLETLRCADYHDGILACGKYEIVFSSYPKAKASIEAVTAQTTIRKRRGVEAIQNPGKLIKYNTAKTIARAVTCYLGKADIELRNAGINCVSISCVTKSGLFWRMKNSDADTAAMMATRYIYSHYHSSEKIMKFQLRQLDKDYRAWVPTSE